MLWTVNTAICEECGGVRDMAIGWFLPTSLGALMLKESWLLQLFLLAGISALCPEVNSHHMQCFWQFLGMPSCSASTVKPFCKIAQGGLVLGMATFETGEMRFCFTKTRNT